MLVSTPSRIAKVVGNRQETPCMRPDAVNS